jgi:hypothetical protein
MPTEQELCVWCVGDVQMDDGIDRDQGGDAGHTEPGVGLEEQVIRPARRWRGAQPTAAEAQAAEPVAPDRRATPRDWRYVLRPVVRTWQVWALSILFVVAAIVLVGRVTQPNKATARAWPPPPGIDGPFVASALPRSGAPFGLQSVLPSGTPSASVSRTSVPVDTTATAQAIPRPAQPAPTNKPAAAPPAPTNKPAAAPPAALAFDANRTNYPGTASAMGMCLNAGGGQGEAVDIQNCDGGRSEVFDVQTGAANVLFQRGNECLQPLGSFDNYTNIGFEPCDGGAAQQWAWNSDNSVVNVASRRCMDIPAFDNTAGVLVIIYDCNGGANQRWGFNGA